MSEYSNPPSFKFIDNLYNDNWESELKSYIENPLNEIWNEEGKDKLTFLHKTIIFDNDGKLINTLFNAIHERLKDNPNKTEIINTFVNKKNNNGATALHYASFHGKYLHIKLLIENGADVNACDDNKENVLHYAAKGGQPTSLTYFIEKQQMKININNNRSQTPLHLAALNGKDTTIPFLLKWKAQINAQDDDGNTPLHLAVKHNHIKVVKVLLMYGADRDIKEYKHHETPVDVVHCGKSKREMINIFQKRGICEELFFRPEISTKKYRKANMIFFFIIHIIITCINVLFFQPIFAKYILFYSYLGVLLLEFIMFFILSCSNPGIAVHKNRNLIHFLEKHPERDIGNYCPHCIIEKKYQTVHCVVCNVCVDGFDHHCFWVDNCVGVNTYFLFFAFLTLVNVNIAFNLVEAIRAIYIGYLNDQVHWSTMQNKFDYMIRWEPMYRKDIRIAMGVVVIVVCVLFLPATLWMIKWQLARVFNYDKKAYRRDHKEEQLIESGFGLYSESEYEKDKEKDKDNN
jgi:ankyrin repeat protein